MPDPRPTGHLGDPVHRPSEMFTEDTTNLSDAQMRDFCIAMETLLTRAKHGDVSTLGGIAERAIEDVDAGITRFGLRHYYLTFVTDPDRRVSDL